MVSEVPEKKRKKTEYAFKITTTAAAEFALSRSRYKTFLGGNKIYCIDSKWVQAFRAPLAPSNAIYCPLLTCFLAFFLHNLYINSGGKNKNYCVNRQHAIYT